MVAAADSKRAYEVERVSYVVVLSTWQEAASSTIYNTGVLVYRTKVLLHELKTTCCLQRCSWESCLASVSVGLSAESHGQGRLSEGGQLGERRGGCSCAARNSLNTEIVPTAASKAPLEESGVSKSTDRSE